MNNNKIFLSCIGSANLTEHLKRFFSIISGEEFDNLSIEIDLEERELSLDYLEEIIKIEKTFGKDTHFTIKNTLMLRQPIKSNRIISKLNKHGIGVKIKVNSNLDSREVIKMAKKMKKVNIYIGVLAKNLSVDEAIRLSKDLLPYEIGIYYEDLKTGEKELCDWFDFFVEKNNGINCNLMTDCIGRILMNITGNMCQYNSCLGKYFNIQADGRIFACKNQKENALIGNLMEYDAYEQLLSQDNILNTLVKNIEKRESCRRTCSKFEICQGGCPFDETLCKNNSYLSLYNHISERIAAMESSADLSVLPTFIRKQILNSIAFGMSYEKEEH